MGKEFNAVESNVEILDNVAIATLCTPSELDELSLALVGGGNATVNF